LSDNEHFRQTYLLPALQSGLIEMTISAKPTSRLQKSQTRPALPRRQARYDALLTMAVWIVVVGISYRAKWNEDSRNEHRQNRQYGCSKDFHRDISLTNPQGITNDLRTVSPNGYRQQWLRPSLPWNRQGRVRCIIAEREPVSPGSFGNPPLCRAKLEYG
jgi:hypothetical protein